MAGLDLTDEQRKAEIVALVRELNGYEARVAAGDESFAERVELVRDQLAQRGYAAAAPQQRAQTRERKSVEQRGGNQRADRTPSANQ